MTDPSTEFFAQLESAGPPPQMRHVVGTIRVDLDHDKTTDHWLLNFDKGKVSISNKNAKADAILHTDKALFDRLARGEANGMASVLRGLMAVEGDQELLILLQRALPGPAKSRKSKSTANAKGPST